MAERQQRFVFRRNLLCDVTWLRGFGGLAGGRIRQPKAMLESGFGRICRILSEREGVTHAHKLRLRWGGGSRTEFGTLGELLRIFWTAL